HSPKTHAHADAAHPAHAAHAPEASASHAKTTPATEEKTTETKTGAKASKGKGATKEKAPVVSSKPAKKKGVKITWVKKEKHVKGDVLKAIQEELADKWKPVFWGRFGKKNLRKRTNPKFDKWRKPRGEDMQQRRDDGAVVAVGYRTPKSIRGVHPSGYREVLVASVNDMKKLTPLHAARISGTVGRKKRVELITYANKNKIYVIN
ncbi:MAG: eL32 family ribosomal protein, partial [archaeon]